ncbi:hypothetical protein R1sor_004809 [Riccia sorocarpa]|uniref:Uncharacterized protein n=1 Tax=Riccia sorocarpa TaxID=122646 RepID=A0ABD3HHQ3_9MARC
MAQTKIRYQLEGPLPADLTLGELQTLNSSLKAFSIARVSEYIGKAGIIPIEWTETQLDWYLETIEFVRIGKLLKGKETIDGPFKFVTGDTGFVCLEDSNGTSVHEVNDAYAIGSQEQEEYEIEEALSQNVCLCKEFFQSNDVCFCGFRRCKKDEGGSQSPETAPTMTEKGKEPAVEVPTSPQLRQP